MRALFCTFNLYLHFFYVPSHGPTKRINIIYMCINLHNWLIIEANYPIAKGSLGLSTPTSLCCCCCGTHTHTHINKSINTLCFPIISSYFILVQHIVPWKYLNMYYFLFITQFLSQEGNASSYKIPIKIQYLICIYSLCSHNWCCS